ncbi:MAG TPA: MBL fold metallo-hydrolase [Solirubrobacterales bacterium]|jgi:beta-lactamase superfamily II metal-dependent hydrolase|nr:MBL fold metallo-hydrolase [Solirubrobacterales bacterium]
MPTAAPPIYVDVPADSFDQTGEFTQRVGPDDLVHFVLNVGDGDTQVLLLPEEERSNGKRTRKAIVVDVVPAGKLERLIGALQAEGLLDSEGKPLELVVATHPHADHISGMGSFLRKRKAEIGTFMESAYFMPTKSYFQMMEALAGAPEIDHLQPSSGTVLFIDQVKITILAPGVGLKGRYDSYGIDPNNSSIALRVDFPARRYYMRGKDGSYDKLPNGASLILGADAQTLSWSQVLVDFPQLEADDSAVAEALRKARGVEPLNADVFKVPHHGSKHGLNLELVEAIDPSVSLISSVRGGGKYNFPHRVSLEALREGLEATTGKGSDHSLDHELGIHYTCGREEGGGKALGTIAAVIGPSGRAEVWRFGDEPGDSVDLAAGRHFKRKPRRHSPPAG